jgi:methylthioribose-1-phosphate isomerase
VALACRDAGIPFMVAAPWSTVDLSMADGSHIEIEERPGEEVTVLGGVRLAPEASPGFNPAFDVTPARLVDAVATERGVAEPRTGTDLRALA